MKIIKVFNNNVVLVDDEKHEQAILFGNGIGFKKQPGDEVVKTKGVQTFIKISRTLNGLIRYRVY